MMTTQGEIKFKCWIAMRKKSQEKKKERNTHLMFPQHQNHRRQQQLRVFVAGQSDDDHVVSELLVSPEMGLVRRDHAAAQPVGRRLIITVAMVKVTPEDGGAELISEGGDQLPRSLTAPDGEAVKEGEVEEQGFEDLALEAQLEGV